MLNLGQEYLGCTYKMKRGIQGRLLQRSIGDENYCCFIPNPLPPQHEIDIPSFSALLEKANLAIGALNGVASTVPDPSVINYMYVRKEAVLSSQIEGTQSTLDDLMLYEARQIQGIPVNDVTEVSSYVAALNHGMERINSGFPLSLRLIREIHSILLQNSRGKNKLPGEFRNSQNWIGDPRPGNAKFVPCPPEDLMTTLGQLEIFMNTEDNMSTLVKIALIHLQFETIHPFLDGNGRLGRLLITLFLQTKGILKSSFFYLSLFFKKNRSLYYNHLNNVRYNGDWESWIEFFLEGVIEIANDARKTVTKIQKLFTDDENKLSSLKRASVSAKEVLYQFQKKPILTVAEIEQHINLSRPTIISAINNLIKVGILQNISEKKWGQIYAYSRYTDLLN